MVRQEQDKMTELREDQEEEMMVRNQKLRVRRDDEWGTRQAITRASVAFVDGFNSPAVGSIVRRG